MVDSRYMLFVKLIYKHKCLNIKIILNIIDGSYRLLFVVNKIDLFKGSDDLMDKVSTSQPQDRGSNPLQVTTMIIHITPVLVSSRKRTQEWLIRCLFHNRAKINMVKLNWSINLIFWILINRLWSACLNRQRFNSSWEFRWNNIPFQRRSEMWHRIQCIVRHYHMSS